MIKPVYTSAAREDLANILAYIARDKPQAAVEWMHKIEAKCLLIAEQPKMGKLQPRLGVGVRSNFVGRYVIFHRENSERVEILRVIPGDRNITTIGQP
jgi:toxin ParE1/3/4